MIDDTKEQFFSAINGILRELNRPELSFSAMQKQFCQPWTKIFRDAGITEEEAGEAILYKMYNALYTAGPSPKPFPDLLSTLEWLKEKNITLGVISAQSNKINIPQLQKCGLKKFFANIVGGAGDKSAVMSDRIKEMCLDPKEMAYVGDQVDDIRQAKKAGCVSIAFCGGIHTEEQLEAERPDYLIREHREIIRLDIF